MPGPACLLSAALLGVEAVMVHVEVDVTNGLPQYWTVGLPDSAVRESRQRVRSAILNAGFEYPQQRITVNLAPADIRKEGAAFDVPIALGILMAKGLVHENQLGEFAVVGELALTGEIQPVRGALAVALACRRRGVTTLIVPRDNATEAMAVDGVRVLCAGTLGELIAVLKGAAPLARPPAPKIERGPEDADLAEVHGQAHAKRALEIAAAGGHNVLMIGPPGTGKTMLARRLTTILPPLSRDEVLEVSSLWSVAGLLQRRGGLVDTRPFRAPHHTISVSGLIGGGTPLRPGEVTLAHRGVLFMDELPEFQQHVLESLRQPLEDGRVALARAHGIGDFPARFQLVAAANPCRRGCPALERCVCTPAERDRYLGRLSGPLLDRIDLHVELPALEGADYVAASAGEDSAAVRVRVAKARERQRGRGRTGATRLNAEISSRTLRRLCPIPPDAQSLLAAAMTRLGLSARGHDRVVRVARTIADLAGAESIATEHCAEALQYRGLDRRWRA